MAINPLQLPGPIQQPQLDWSRLDAIGDAIMGARQRQAEAEALSGLVDSVPARQPAPTPQPAMQPTGGVPNVGTSIPRGIRNNNPGNIEDGPFARSMPGYKGSDGRFAIFETPDNGMQAMDSLLTAYGRRGLKSVSDVIGRWAPAADGNNVTAYAQFVANGADPNAPVDLANPEVRRGIATRMAQFENGRPVATDAAPGVPAPTSAAAAPAAAPASGIPEAQAKRIKALIAAGGEARKYGLQLLTKYIGKQEPIKLGEGDILVDPNTYQPIARGNPKRDPNRRETEEDKFEGRKRIAERLGMKPGDPQTQLYLTTGKMPGEDRVSPTQLKMIAEAEDENTNLKTTLEQLTRASELNSKTFTGAFADSRRRIGTMLPDWMVPDRLADPATAQATEEWQKIMEPEALQIMANTLKGATTDFELRTFIKQLADPATTPETRAKVIQRMTTLAERKMQVNQTRMDQIRGNTYTKPGGGQSNVVSTKIPQGAVDQLKANPSRQARQQFDEVFGAGEAAKILGSGPR